jgi:phosphoenolpyruvate-protein phosphotransferase
MQQEEYTLVGEIAAPGIAVGPALLYSLYPAGFFRAVQTESRYRKTSTAADDVLRLEKAIAAAEREMEQERIRLVAEGRVAESHIFDEHRKLLRSSSLYERAVTLITKAGWRASEAIVEAGEQEIAPLADTDDPYLRVYAADVRDIVQQVRRLLVREHSLGDILTHPAIVVSSDLGLSEWMNVPRDRLLGLVLAGGGTVSHSSIMARSLGVPTIIGLGPAVLRRIASGVMLAMDGASGQIVVHPQEATIEKIRARGQEEEKQTIFLRSQCNLASVTQDGHEVGLLANAGTVIEARTAREWGAMGIGSLRTELLFLGRPTLPDEDEQLELYRAIAQEMPGCPIVIRTLDVGGDKPLPSFPIPRERNPFLGWRGIRIGLNDSERVLLPQIRAILRAGGEGDVRMVLPMITNIGEVQLVRTMVEQAHRDLVTAGVPCCEVVRLGVMVEIPAAALMAERLAQECDFLSIGSNDLVQYTLACDRTNERVAGLYQPLEPAVLRLMQTIIDAGHGHGQRVSLCGEMASDPTLTALMIGMGIDELSCTPRGLPLVRAAVRATDAARARELAQNVLAATSLEEVRRLMQNYWKQDGVW